MDFVRFGNSDFVSMNLSRFGILMLMGILSSGILSADTIPAGSTDALVSLIGSGGVNCTANELTSASCSQAGSVATAVVTDGEGDMQGFHWEVCHSQAVRHNLDN